MTVGHGRTGPVTGVPGPDDPDLGGPSKSPLGAAQLVSSDCPAAYGALFHADRKPSTLMRINFATTQDAAFWKKYSEMVRRM